MQSPIFSVIIPVYNQAEFLGEAIESVLSQTYPDFEVIVVNDASPDQTSEVVKQFKDARLRQIVHAENRGLPAARNTGMRASSGEFIALLDADDFFHPEKLASHLAYFTDHPEVSITCNGRFELHHSSKKIRAIYVPPPKIGLKDFVMGFPFAPSDMVMRRDCAFHVNLFDEQYVCGGEDLDFPCRLALEGYKFGLVARNLTFRRFHSGRIRKKLRCRLDDYRRALDTVFYNPRCPRDIFALGKKGYASHYLEVACWAMAQGELDLGHEVLSEVIQLDPATLEFNGSKLVKRFLMHSIKDENLDHEEMLRFIFSNLPGKLMWLSEQVEWAVSRGYLLKGTRAVVWGNDGEASSWFEKAKEYNADIDQSYINELAHQLLQYEAEYGVQAAQTVIQNLSPYFKLLEKKSSYRVLLGLLAVNRAYNSYKLGEYQAVQRHALRALSHDPSYILNRGVLSMMVRAFLKSPVLNNK